MKFLIVPIFFALASCQNSAQIDTVHIPQTASKTQTAGDCWAYATLGAIESILLQEGFPAEDYSEAFLLYQYWNEQLNQSMTSKTPDAARHLLAGGSYAVARSLIASYGLVKQTDFQAAHTEIEAQNSLETSLATGPLRALFNANTSARADLIAAELNKAFGIAAPLPNPILPSTIYLPARNLSLSDELYRWYREEYPINMDSLPPKGKPFLAAISSEQDQILRKVYLALNKHEPVLIEWLVDDNALDANGQFSIEALLRRGKPGGQGYHITVLSDYIVEVPGGENWEELPEGEISPELKNEAALKGRLKAFVTKNSWGNARSRPSMPGFHSLAAEYLLSWIPRTDDSLTSDLVLRGFVLPK